MYKQKTRFTIGVISLSILLFVSCSTSQYSYRTANIDNKDLKISDQYIVDVEVDLVKVITAQSGTHKTIQAAKDEAYYNAITQNNIHILVDPIYKVTTMGSGSIASVSGFAGEYKNVRKMRSELEKIEKENFEMRKKHIEELTKIPELNDIKTKVYSSRGTSLLEVKEKSLIDLYEQLVNDRNIHFLDIK